eukprot:scaffold28550_cov35-Tisochrysis_lutea.AAC.1
MGVRRCLLSVARLSLLFGLRGRCEALAHRIRALCAIAAQLLSSSDPSATHGARAARLPSRHPGRQRGRSARGHAVVAEATTPRRPT